MSAVLRLARCSTASVVAAGMLLGGTQLVLGQVAQAKNMAMRSTVALNVRSGPGIQNPVVGLLSPGEKVTATGPSRNGWTPVRHEGRNAWVASNYLAASRGDAATSAAAVSGSGRAWTTEALNVRTGPGIDNSVVTVLGRGTEISTTGRSSGPWLQVSLGGRSAWVHGSWVSRGQGTSNSQSSPVTTSTAQRARATADLMIRTRPDASYRSLGDIPVGTILQLTGKRAPGVAQVLWEGNLRWVNANFIQKVGNTSLTPIPSAAKTIGTRYATTTLSIRPSSTGQRYLYDVPAGTALQVTGVVENGRAQVVVQGATRWVTSIYLSASNPVNGGGATGGVRAFFGGNLNTGGSSGLNGLTGTAKGIVATARANFPRIATMYGVRQDPLPDHPSGHAVDLMIPSYRSNQDLGWQIARYMQEHASELNVKYIIFGQKIWSVARSNEGWRPMANRGGDTANHYDHVHVTVN